MTMQRWMGGLVIVMGAALAACGGDGGSSQPTATESTREWDIPAVSASTQFQEFSGLELASRDVSGSIAAQPFLSFQPGGRGFASSQADLVVDDTNGFTDIFRRLDSGLFRRISMPDSPADPDNTLGLQANGNSGILTGFAGQNLTRHTVASSDMARYTAFVSEATNLAGTDTNGVADVYVRYAGSYNSVSGVWSSVPRTYRVSLAADGSEPTLPSFSPSVSQLTDTVAFVTASPLVPADTNGTYDVYLRNLVTGNLTLVSRPGPGLLGNGPSFDPQIARGYVFFLSWADNLDSNDTNNALDLFAYNMDTAVVKRVPLAGADGQGDKGLLGAAYAGQINLPSRIYSASASGRYVAFLSESTNLVAGDTNGRPDAFVRDLARNITTRVSTNAAGTVTGATFNGIAMSKNDGSWNLNYGDVYPVVFFTSDQPYFATQTGGSGIDVYARVFFTNKMYRLSNLVTDSWPIANVDYLQEADSSHVIFSGSANAIGGGTVNGVFSAHISVY